MLLSQAVTYCTTKGAAIQDEGWTSFIVVRLVRENVIHINWIHLFLFLHGLHHLFFCSNPYRARHLRLVELALDPDCVSGGVSPEVLAPTGYCVSGDLLKDGAFCPGMDSLLCKWGPSFNGLTGDFASLVGSKPLKGGGIWPKNWGGTPLDGGDRWDPLCWPDG